MSGKVVCVANRKGGVGKTTVAVLLAQTLQDQLGRPVALVDVDPQASATFALAGEDLLGRLEEVMIERTLERQGGLDDKTPLSAFAWGQVSALTRRPDVPLILVPCSPNLWTLEGRIADASLLGNPRKGVAAQFAKLLKRLKKEASVVIIDTPPGQSFLGRESVDRADLVLVPCDATRLAYRALEVFVDELRSRGMTKKSYLLWTKNRNLGEIKTFEDGLSNKLRQRKLFDDTWDQNLQGIRQSPSFAKNVVQTRARSFESVYPGLARQIADALGRAVLKRLNMEQSE